MSKQLEITDEKLAEAILVFEDHVNGLTIDELTKKYDVSRRTIDNRLADARDWYYNKLKESGKREAIKIWKKYEKLETRAWAQLETTNDPSWAKALMEIFKAMRDMMKLDLPPQAPVNQAGETVIPQIIFNISDEKYKLLEKEQTSSKNVIIDGEVKILNG